MKITLEFKDGTTLKYEGESRLPGQVWLPIIEECACGGEALSDDQKQALTTTADLLLYLHVMLHNDDGPMERGIRHARRSLREAFSAQVDFNGE